MRLASLYSWRKLTQAASSVSLFLTDCTFPNTTEGRGRLCLRLLALSLTPPLKAGGGEIVPMSACSQSHPATEGRGRLYLCLLAVSLTPPLKAGGDCTYVFLLSASPLLVFLFYEAAVRKTPQWASQIQMPGYMVCRQRAVCSTESPYCTVTCCHNATRACTCLAVHFFFWRRTALWPVVGCGVVRRELTSTLTRCAIQSFLWSAQPGEARARRLHAVVVQQQAKGGGAEGK